MVHKESGHVTIIGFETASGHYEAELTVERRVSNVPNGKALMTNEIETRPPWHERLGHASEGAIRDSIAHLDVIDANEVDPNPATCNSCMIGKSTCHPRKK